VNRTLTYSAPSRLLTVADLTTANVQRILTLANRYRQSYGWTTRLQGHTVACYFEKPSTRTRVSFEVAAHRLGMLPIMLRPEELQLGRGETVADTARVLGGYCDAIVARVFDQALLEEMADAAQVPVVNALSDSHHPCQALADVLTLRDEFHSLANLRVAYVGDLNNVARSLLEVGALTGIEVVVAAPDGYRGTQEELDRINELGDRAGGSVRVTDDPCEAVRDADAVYTDVWVSMGEDAEAARRMRDLDPYRVTERLMQLARPHAIFLHCLPAHRGQEVDADVIDGRQSRVFKQAANRMPIAQAVLYALVTRDWSQREDG
jgi:ornithine carbamoyltransferase